MQTLLPALSTVDVVRALLHWHLDLLSLVCGRGSPLLELHEVKV